MCVSVLLDTTKSCKNNKLTNKYWFSFMRSYQESANRQQLLLTAVYNADCSLLCRITISCLYYKSYSCMRIAYTAVCAALTAMGAHTVSPSSNLHITTHLKLNLYALQRRATPGGTAVACFRCCVLSCRCSLYPSLAPSTLV